jgi:4'-phosphopantetheinyl transferase EntD
VIESLLPSSVVCVRSFADRLDTPLFPEEEAVIARAAAKRRAEFTTVRAREALAKLGQPPAPLLTASAGPGLKCRRPSSRPA